MRPPFKNLTVFAGYVGNDPDLRYTSTGVAVVSLRICAQHSWIDEKKQRQTIDEWATAVFYRGLADEVAKSVKKGAFAHVEGRRQSRRLPATGSGRPPTVNEIIVTSWHLVDLRGESVPDTQGQPIELDPSPQDASIGVPRGVDRGSPAPFPSTTAGLA